MSAEENKLAVRRYFEEVWTKGNLDVIDELFTDDYTGNISIYGDEPVIGREGMRELVSTLRAAFPDIELGIEQQYADGDTVITHWRARATHQGDLFGVPATGRQAELRAVMIAHCRQGTIFRVRCTFDVLSLLQQLGLAPPLSVAQTPLGRAAFWLYVHKARAALAGLAVVGLLFVGTRRLRAG